MSPQTIFPETVGFFSENLHADGGSDGLAEVGRRTPSIDRVRDPLHVGRALSLDPNLFVGVYRHLDQIVPHEQWRDRRQVGPEEARPIIHHQISESDRPCPRSAAPGATATTGRAGSV